MSRVAIVIVGVLLILMGIWFVHRLDQAKKDLRAATASARDLNRKSDELLAQIEKATPFLKPPDLPAASTPIEPGACSNISGVRDVSVGTMITSRGLRITSVPSGSILAVNDVLVAPNVDARAGQALIDYRKSGGWFFVERGDTHFCIRFLPSGS